MRRENDVCQGRSFAVPPAAPSSPAPHSKARAARYGVTARAQGATAQTPQAAHAMQGQSSAPAQAMPPSNFGRGLPGANGQQQFVLLPKPSSSITKQLKVPYLHQAVLPMGTAVSQSLAAASPCWALLVAVLSALVLHRPRPELEPGQGWVLGWAGTV